MLKTGKQQTYLAISFVEYYAIKWTYFYQTMNHRIEDR